MHNKPWTIQAVESIEAKAAHTVTLGPILVERKRRRRSMINSEFPCPKWDYLLLTILLTNSLYIYYPLYECFNALNSWRKISENWALVDVWYRYCSKGVNAKRFYLLLYTPALRSIYRSAPRGTVASWELIQMCDSLLRSYSCYVGKSKLTTRMAAVSGCHAHFVFSLELLLIQAHSDNDFSRSIILLVCLIIDLGEAERLYLTSTDYLNR